MTARPPLPESEDSVLAAEYVLGTLPASERVAFAHRIATEPAVAASVRYWEEHFSVFADEIDPVTPPADAGAAIEVRLFGSQAKRTGGFSGFWNSLALWRSLAVTGLVAVIVLGGLQLREETQPVAGGFVAQVTGEQAVVRLVAYYDAQRGTLRLNRAEGTPATNRSFELWLIAGSEPPVSLGVLPAPATAELLVPEMLRAKFVGGVLAISDEPAGGSPTGAPTGAVLATGPLTAI